MESDNNLRIVKLTDQNFMRTLESSIRLGLPMLIWEVGETLDPTLKPVLTKSVFQLVSGLDYYFNICMCVPYILLSPLLFHDS